MKKKHVVEIIILLLSACVVFFLGWTQFRVGAGKCGILVSKTGGVNRQPVIPGKFTWHWECLLPTNTDLRIFSLKPYSSVKTIRGELPSADIYSSSYDKAPDFTYDFSFTVSEKVTPENLVALVQDSTFTDSAGLFSYLDSAADVLSKKAAAYLLDKSSSDPSFKPSSITMQEYLDVIDAKREYPHITFAGFTLSSCRIPDRELYDSAREAYLSQEKAKQARAAERKKKVNELLDQFPELRSLFSSAE